MTIQEISKKAPDFISRNIVTLSAIVISLWAIFYFANYSQKVESENISDYSQLNKIREQQPYNIEALNQLSKRTHQRETIVKNTGLLQMGATAIFAGLIASLIAGIIAYVYTKIKFHRVSANTANGKFAVLAAIIKGSLILTALIFASYIAKGEQARSSSLIAINGIKEFEGFRSNPYKCPAGVWTDGYGNTFNVKPGIKKTRFEATVDLQRNLVKFENGLLKRIQRPLNQHRFDALVMFTYNLGTGVIKGTLRQQINYGFDALVAERLKLYVKAGGVTLRGLVRRRDVESSVYLGKCVVIQRFYPQYRGCNS